jgi:hypothetical protein
VVRQGGHPPTCGRRVRGLGPAEGIRRGWVRPLPRSLAVTPDGCENLAPKWSGTPEEPAVV